MSRRSGNFTTEASYHQVCFADAESSRLYVPSAEDTELLVLTPDRDGIYVHTGVADGAVDVEILSDVEPSSTVTEQAHQLGQPVSEASIVLENPVCLSGSMDFMDDIPSVYTPARAGVYRVRVARLTDVKYPDLAVDRSEEVYRIWIWPEDEQRGVEFDAGR